MKLGSLIGISLNLIKSQLVNEVVIINTAILRVVAPHLNSLIDKEDLNIMNIINVSVKIKKLKKLSEYLFG